MEQQYELSSTAEAPHARPSTMPHDEPDNTPQHDAALHKRTLRKLDGLLLSYLALLFLFNSLDKSNVDSPSTRFLEA